MAKHNVRYTISGLIFMGAELAKGEKSFLISERLYRAVKERVGVDR